LKQKKGRSTGKSSHAIEETETKGSGRGGGGFHKSLEIVNFGEHGENKKVCRFSKNQKRPKKNEPWGWTLDSVC